jgi:hypothetical protein
MNTDTVKSDNEVIEDFYVSQGGKPSLKEDLGFYESDWNMLIPVVNKIAEFRLAYPTKANEVCDLKVVVMLPVLYKRVVEFIKWYNANKS